MEGEECDLEKWPQLANMSYEELWVFMEDEEKLEAVRKIPTFLLLSVLMLVGLPGNVLVLLVYGVRFPASTTKCFIMAMAAFDVMNCAVGMPFEMVDLKRDLDLDIPISCKIFRFLVTLSSCGSVTVLVIVSLDRFRRICRPFQKQMTVRQSKVIIGGMLLLSLAFSTPALVLYGRRTDVRFNHTVYECSIDDAYRDSVMARGYQILLGVTWVACIIILVVMYSFIVYNIRKQKQRRQNLASTSYGSQSVLNKIKISITDTTSTNERQHSAAPPLHTEILAASDDHVLTCSRNGDAAIYALNSTDDAEEAPGKDAMCRLVSAVKEQEERIARITAENMRSASRSSQKRRSKKRSSETSRSMARSSDASGSVKRNSEVSRSVKRLFSRDANPLFQDDEDDDDATSDINVTSFGDEVSLTGSAYISINATKSSLNNYLEGSMDTGFTLRSGSCYRDEIVNSKPDVIPVRARKQGHFLGRYRPWDSMCVAGQTRVLSTMMDRDWTSNSFPLLDGPETQAGSSVRRASSLPCLLSSHGRNSDESGFEDFSEIPAAATGTRLKEETSNEAGIHISFSKKRASSLVSQTVAKNPHLNVTWESIHDNSFTPSRTSKTSQVSAIRQPFANGFRTPSVATTSTSKSRKKSCVRDIKTSRVSFMMFLVTLGFVLSYLPHLAIQVFGVLSPSLVARLLCPRSGYYIAHHLLMRSFFINNAINPIIYSFYNKTFRARCLRLLKSPKSLLKASTNDFGISVSQDNDTS